MIISEYLGVCVTHELGHIHHLNLIWDPYHVISCDTWHTRRAIFLLIQSPRKYISLPIWFSMSPIFLSYNSLTLAHRVAVLIFLHQFILLLYLRLIIKLELCIICWIQLNLRLLPVFPIPVSYPTHTDWWNQPTVLPITNSVGGVSNPSENSLIPLSHYPRDISPH